MRFERLVALARALLHEGRAQRHSAGERLLDGAAPLDQVRAVALLAALDAGAGGGRAVLLGALALARGGTDGTSALPLAAADVAPGGA